MEENKEPAEENKACSRGVPFDRQKERYSIEKLYITKLKTISNGRRVHKVFFSTKQERETFVNTILKAQGLNSHLEQYQIIRKVDKPS